MTLFTIVEEKVVPVGTGFMISPDGLMMTAKHVIDEAIARFDRHKKASGKYYDCCELYALLVDTERELNDPRNSLGAIIPVYKIWRTIELDIAYCFLHPIQRNGVRYTFSVAKLSPGIPKLGSKVLGFGYYKMEGGIIVESGDFKRSNYSQNTAFTRGVITEVHRVQRDAAMLRFPCFRTDARFDAGMSGGPIFNDFGSVCGVICSSFESVTNPPQYTSYGSLIWPALGTALDEYDDDNRLIRSVTAFELAQKDIISCDETLSMISLDDNRAISIQSR
ncbi:serine protease [Nevskia sp.]|uniref:S1 family peptidase n=1 Tax=Nevskia sp. TaxID=1929292 RepID=UPI0025E1EFEF|nr:serine protease [Nevskia sp.]